MSDPKPLYARRSPEELLWDYAEISHGFHAELPKLQRQVAELGAELREGQSRLLVETGKLNVKLETVNQRVDEFVRRFERSDADAIQTAIDKEKIAVYERRNKREWDVVKAIIVFLVIAALGVVGTALFYPTRAKGALPAPINSAVPH